MSNETTSDNSTELNLLDADDATWILTSSFVIFTMQTGFGLLESGAISKKNEVNILVKNAADVIFGALSYWVYGYGLQYGKGRGTTFFCGIGDFLLDTDPDEMGIVFATFIFQLSFATTATTIVSGAMAERANFNAYCIFSFVNTITYCIPAGWIWGNHGFLKHLGVIDFAGSCAVHLTGGASALTAAILLKPRVRRYKNGTDPIPMGNPANAIVGTFTLWWGWLVFNCGSTFGIRNDKWHYAGRAAINTINASLGGGVVGIIMTYYKNRLFLVFEILNSILGALVSVTAGSSLFHSWESVIVGGIGALIINEIPPILDRFRIDDPVGAVAVHAVGGIWAMIAVGLFIDADTLLHLSSGNKGLFKGGGFYLLGIQLLSCLCIASWSITTTFLILKGINFIVPIRLTFADEILGADFVEHDIRHDIYDYEKILEELEKRKLKPSRLPKYSAGRTKWDEYLILKYLSTQERIEAWTSSNSKPCYNFNEIKVIFQKPRRNISCIIS
ncbi:putative ammonium transporter 3 [Centruroides sculpturatus]|uniref:putative ammonium transporter 3 n=1 Tax=Centruroides sculpturatus TaxID=218467 RepID=UPI000C6ED3B8|nr:putative ammonium transporter 3 [Centruroides sculpturatus]